MKRANLIVAVLLLSCGGSAAPSDGSASDGSSEWSAGRVIPIDVPATPLGVGEETLDLCYSLTLHNDIPIFVSQVRMEATLGVHHSNWFYVPDTSYAGDDGLWPCSARAFDQAVAASVGGVLFAQSTQATAETMAFPAGDALAVPANARVVVNLHYVNYTGAPLEPTMALEVTTVPEAQVTTVLHSFAFSYNDLHLPARTRSEFTIDCDLDTQHRASLRRPLDFGVHYVLPHYHGLGTYLRLGVVGGPSDGATIWETNSAVGEPLGGAPEPAVDLTGATGIRLTCRFENPGDTEVVWGNGGGEMCIAFGYSDSPNLWANVGGIGTVAGVVDGVTMNTAPCSVVTAHPPL